MTLTLTVQAVKGRRGFYLGSVLIRNYFPLPLYLNATLGVALRFVFLILLPPSWIMRLEELFFISPSAILNIPWNSYKLLSIPSI
jgi:hypothetical protein